MIWCATPEAHEIVSVATNNAETARCYNAGQKYIRKEEIPWHTKSYETEHDLVRKEVRTKPMSLTQ